MYAANSRTSAIRFVAVGVVALLLAGCGGGAKTVENPLTTTGVQPATTTSCRKSPWLVSSAPNSAIC